jgi:hypothetical protein
MSPLSVSVQVNCGCHPKIINVPLSGLEYYFSYPIPLTTYAACFAIEFLGPESTPITVACALIELNDIKTAALNIFKASVYNSQFAAEVSNYINSALSANINEICDGSFSWYGYFSLQHPTLEFRRKKKRALSATCEINGALPLCNINNTIGDCCKLFIPQALYINITCQGNATVTNLIVLSQALANLTSLNNQDLNAIFAYSFNVTTNETFDVSFILNGDDAHTPQQVATLLTSLSPFTEIGCYVTGQGIFFHPNMEQQKLYLYIYMHV